MHKRIPATAAGPATLALAERSAMARNLSGASARLVGVRLTSVGGPCGGSWLLFARKPGARERRSMTMPSHNARRPAALALEQPVVCPTAPSAHPGRATDGFAALRLTRRLCTVGRCRSTSGQSHGPSHLSLARICAHVLALRGVGELSSCRAIGAGTRWNLGV